MKALWIYEQPSRLQQMGINVFPRKTISDIWVLQILVVSANYRGRVGGGGSREATAQPPAKTEAEVFVFGDGIRLARRQRG